MQGKVSLENKGGFIQMTLDLTDEIQHKIANYTGLFMEVFGNDEQYNIHLRTHEMPRPWQSYRSSFIAAPEFKTHYFPFVEFVPHRIETELDISRIRRIGVVAIGREQSSDLCIAKLGLYHDK